MRKSLIMIFILYKYSLIFIPYYLISILFSIILNLNPVMFSLRIRGEVYAVSYEIFKS